jgi:hypothetical protein
MKPTSPKALNTRVVDTRPPATKRARAKPAAAAAGLEADCARARIVKLEIDRLSAERKVLYKEHDELVGKLRPLGAATEAHGVRLKSRFAGSNTQFGLGPVREIEIELLPPATAVDSEGTRKRKTSERASE